MNKSQIRPRQDLKTRIRRNPAPAGFPNVKSGTALVETPKVYHSQLCRRRRKRHLIATDCEKNVAPAT
jgi:hypothetical protein